MPTPEVFSSQGQTPLSPVLWNLPGREVTGGCLSLPRLCEQRSQMVTTSLEEDLGP